MPDGRFLELPLREEGTTALAELVCNQASFLVLDTLAEWIVRAVRPARPEVVAGLAQGGGVLATEVARRLMHPVWVPVSDQARPWFSDALSVAQAGDGLAGGDRGGARWWLDPALLPRLQGRRALLVHDVIGPADRVDAAAPLLSAAGARASMIAVAMTQGSSWVGELPAGVAMVAVFATPVFHLVPGGWMAREETAAWAACPLFRRGVAHGAPGVRPALPPADADDPAG